MKKLLFSLPILALAFFAGCSDDSSSSNSENENEPLITQATHEDSVKVVVYRYDQFLGKNDVEITGEDTTQISVDTLYAKEIDEDYPRTGNVVVVWDAVNKAPYYLRVLSTQKDGDRLLINVESTNVFSAIPDGDFKFSSEIFYDQSKAGDNSGESGAVVFFDEANSTYHPIVIINSPDEVPGENASVGLGFVPICIMCNNPMEIVEKNGFLDIREAVEQNATLQKTLIDYDYEFHPGTIAMPFLGKIKGDQQGTWGNLLKSNIKGAFKESFSVVKNELIKGSALDNQDDGTLANIYVRVDTLKFRNKVDFNLNVSTSWGIPNKFALYTTSSGGLEISNFGLGVGVNQMGEFYLTHFQGKTFVFTVGFVPIAITVKPNLVFKYNINAFAMMNDNWQYKSESKSRSGLSWEKGKGVKPISEKMIDTSYSNHDKYDSFGEYFMSNNIDVAIDGQASAGVYLRTAFLLYGFAGPTFGLGYRFDIDGEIKSEKQFNSDGQWTGYIPDEGHLKIDGGFTFEAGAEVSLFGHKLFSRAYDVADFWKVNFLDFKIPEDLPEGWQQKIEENKK